VLWFLFFSRKYTQKFIQVKEYTINHVSNDAHTYQRACGAAAVRAFAAGGIAVGVQAASDIIQGEVSDLSEYATTALRESFIGAATGAIFGPFGVSGAVVGKNGHRWCRKCSVRKQW